MPDELEKSVVLAVPGVVQAMPLSSGASAIRVGPSAGWLDPKGISTWEAEVSVVARKDMTEAFARSLRATLPGAQIPAKRFPLAAQAVESSPFLAVSGNLAGDARKEGVRTHTVGVDRVSAGFYYFAEGGSGEPVRVQGSLIEMLAPSLGPSSTNADVTALVKDLIDRLLLHFSRGAISELDIELANSLPRLARDGTGLTGIDLETFEASVRAFADKSARWDASARKLADQIAQADRSGKDSARVSLFGEAKKEAPPELAVVVAGTALSLVARPRWTVRGEPREEATPVRLQTPATPPRAQPVAALRAEPARVQPETARAAEPARAQAASAPAHEPLRTQPETRTVEPAPRSAAAPPAEAARSDERSHLVTPNVEPMRSALEEPVAARAMEPAPIHVVAPGAPTPVVVPEPLPAATAPAPIVAAAPVPAVPSPTAPSSAPSPEKAPEAVRAEAPSRDEAPAREAKAKAAAKIAATPAPVRSDVRPAAAAATSGTSSPFTAMHALIVLIAVVLAYFAGRFLRHHYLHMP